MKTVLNHFKCSRTSHEQIYRTVYFVYASVYCFFMFFTNSFSLFSYYYVCELMSCQAGSVLYIGRTYALYITGLFPHFKLKFLPKNVRLFTHYSLLNTLMY